MRHPNLPTAIKNPIPITVDFVIHDEAHPFCDDEDCLCHQDHETFERCVGNPFWDGLLTFHEMLRLAAGQQL